MKLLKGVTVSIFLFLLCFVAPFNIYADTITNSNVLGINTVLLSKSQNVAVTNSWYYVYQHTITLDADYIGTITLDINLTYNNPSGSSSSYGTSTISNKKYFVNGNTIVINQTVTTDNYTNQGPIVSSSYLLKSSNVIKTSTITELQQIIDLLTDIYNSEDQVEGLLNVQLEQLELIVSNTSLANQYLDTISKLRQYNYPIESFNVIYYLIYYNNNISSLFDINYWKYPVFNIPTDTNIYTRYLGNGASFLYMCYVPYNISNTSVLNRYFSAGDNFALDIYSSELIVNTNYSIRRIVIKITNNGDSGNFTLKTLNNFNFFIPIYGILETNISSNYSTDFALQFGLSNRLLDNLDIIANGTSQSNQQASDLSSGTDSMQQQMNNFTSQEDSYNNQMNNSINAIDFTSPVSQNAGILPAANFVINIFNGLIQNNAFSVLILIVCVLIIGKKVIGK